MTEALAELRRLAEKVLERPPESLTAYQQQRHEFASAASPTTILELIARIDLERNRADEAERKLAELDLERTIRLAAVDQMNREHKRAEAAEAEVARLRRTLTSIAWYDPRWTEAHPNDAPNRQKLIERAFDALVPKPKEPSE